MQSMFPAVAARNTLLSRLYGTHFSRVKLNGGRTPFHHVNTTTMIILQLVVVGENVLSAGDNSTLVTTVHISYWIQLCKITRFQSRLSGIIKKTTFEKW